MQSEVLEAFWGAYISVFFYLVIIVIIFNMLFFLNSAWDLVFPPQDKTKEKVFPSPPIPI